MSAHERLPLEYYLSLDYPFQAIADPDDGGWVVVCPDLPGCLTQGDTMAELAEMAEEARRLWIETEYDLGADIPLPSYPEEYSGKFNLRLPRSLHRRLAESAEREGVSLNQYVVQLLSERDAQRTIDTKLDCVEQQLASLERAVQSSRAGVS
jgi:predicted RNase H-like HicB family nuclease